MEKAKGRSNVNFAVLAALVVLLLIIISIFGCLAVRPRSSTPTTVTGKIETGTDACVGWNETRCGALMKIKRPVSGSWKCVTTDGQESLISTSNGKTCMEIERQVDQPSMLYKYIYINPMSNPVLPLDPTGLPYNHTQSGTGAISFSCSSDSDFFCAADNNSKITVNMGDIASKVGTFDNLMSVSLGCKVLGTPALCSAATTCKLTTALQSGPYYSDYEKQIGGGQEIWYFYYYEDDPMMMRAWTGSADAIIIQGYAGMAQRPAAGLVSMSSTLTLDSCNLILGYSPRWKCVDLANGTETNYMSCNILEVNATFQGGSMLLKNNIPQSELEEIIKGYYNGSQPMKQIPFFMIGQGQSFDDFDAAKERCTPFEENQFNISLGNTTFDPPRVKAMKGTDICWDNIDILQHSINIAGSIGTLFNMQLAQGEKKCTSDMAGLLDPGTYYALDSNGDKMDEITILLSSSQGDIPFFVGGRIVPEYGSAVLGSNVTFNATDSKPHLVNGVGWSGLSCGLNPPASCNYTPTSIGEFKVQDSKTNESATILVTSSTDTFTFDTKGSSPDIIPDNKFIVRQYGDNVCFNATSGTATSCGAGPDGWIPDTGGNLCDADYSAKPEYSSAIECRKNTDLNISEFSITDASSALLCNASCAPAVQGVVCQRGLFVSIFREEEGGMKIVERNKQVLPGTKCCIKEPVPGNWEVTTSDGRKVGFFIGQRAKATVTVRPVGFEPARAEIEPNTRICFINNVLQTRSIKVTFGENVIWAPLIQSFDKDCGLVLTEEKSYVTNFISPPLNTVGVISVSKKETFKIKVLPTGFDPMYLKVKPGDDICWVNDDTIEHEITPDSTYGGGDNIHIISGAQDCIMNMKDDSWYSRTDPNSGITSIVASFSGNGFIMTPYGPSPPAVTIEGSYKWTDVNVNPGDQVGHQVERTNISNIKVINALRNALSFTSSENIVLSDKGINRLKIDSISPMNLVISNSDSKAHNLDLLRAGTNNKIGNSIIVTAGNYTTLLVSQEMDIKDTTVSANNLLEMKYYPVLTSIPPLQSATIALPVDVLGAFSLKESSRNFTLTVNIRSHGQDLPQAPLFGQTMDLAVQKVYGLLSSEILARMREYAHNGIVSAIVPTFSDIKVNIRSSSMSPEVLNVTAGSNVTWLNIDNAPHTLNFTVMNFTPFCNATNSSYGCQYVSERKVCQAVLKDPALACYTSEDLSTIRCTDAPGYVNEVDCRMDAQSVGGVCEFRINISDSPKFCTYNSATNTCSPNSIIASYGIINCTRDPSTNNCIATFQPIQGVGGYYAPEWKDWPLTGPFCNRTSSQKCNVSQYAIRNFPDTVSCTGPGNDGKCIVTSTFLDDANATYCKYVNGTGTPYSFLVTLERAKKYNASNMDGFAIWDVTDMTINKSGIVNVIRKDVNVIVGYEDLSPQVAELDSRSFITFSNYMDAANTFQAFESFESGTTTSRVVVPEFGKPTAGAPGYYAWFPSSGATGVRFTHGVLGEADVIYSTSSISIDLKVSDDGYKYLGDEVTTVSLHPGSDVCFSSDDERQVKILKEGAVISIGDASGVPPDPAEVCVPVLDCVARPADANTVECRGQTNSTASVCEYRVQDTDDGRSSACQLIAGQTGCVSKYSGLSCYGPFGDYCLYYPLPTGDACSAKCTPKDTGLGLTCSNYGTTGSDCAFQPTSLPTNDYTTVNDKRCTISGSSCTTTSPIMTDIKCIFQGGKCYIDPLQPPGPGVTVTIGENTEGTGGSDEYCSRNSHPSCSGGVNWGLSGQVGPWCGGGSLSPPYVPASGKSDGSFAVWMYGSYTTDYTSPISGACPGGTYTSSARDAKLRYCDNNVNPTGVTCNSGYSPYILSYDEAIAVYPYSYVAYFTCSRALYYCNCPANGACTILSSCVLASGTYNFASFTISSGTVTVLPPPSMFGYGGGVAGGGAGAGGGGHSGTLSCGCENFDGVGGGQGGSAYNYGSTGSSAPEGGGGGAGGSTGGRISITANTVTITGTLAANGGTGNRGGDGGESTCGGTCIAGEKEGTGGGGGGGGGSGGYVYIKTNSLTQTGYITANGGIGGAGGNGGDHRTDGGGGGAGAGGNGGLVIIDTSNGPTNIASHINTYGGTGGSGGDGPDEAHDGGGGPGGSAGATWLRPGLFGGSWGTTCTNRTSSVTCSQNTAELWKCSYQWAGNIPPKPCSTTAACPCVRCDQKYLAGGLYGTPGNKADPNYNCTTSLEGCTLEPGYTPCKYTNPNCHCQLGTTSACVTKQPYKGVDCLYVNKSGLSTCMVASSTWTYENTKRQICGLNSTGNCESLKYGVTCTDQGPKDANNGDGVCSIDTYVPKFCWKAQEAGEYFAEDIKTGKRTRIQVYERENPLSISIQKGYIFPSTVYTSPKSEVCFISGDGKMHHLRVPAKMADKISEALRVTNEYKCYNVNQGDWIMMLNDYDQGMLSQIPGMIKSEVQDKTVKVKFRMFDPELSILRPGGSLTFRNVDTISQTICGPVWSASGSYSYKLDGAVATNPQGLQTSIKDISVGICGEYGTSAKQSSLSVTFPTYLTDLKISYSFKDNGMVFINGNLLVSDTSKKCAETTGGVFSSTRSVNVPLGYLNLAGSNNITFVMCGCSASMGVESSMRFGCVAEPDASNLPVCMTTQKNCNTISRMPFFQIYTIPPGGEQNVSTGINSVGVYVFIHHTTPRAFVLYTKTCEGDDLIGIASSVGRHELLEYSLPICEYGGTEECTPYNPFGISTTAIITTESNLNLSNPNERQCAFDQVAAITENCPTCAAALYVGSANTSKIDSIFSQAGITNTKSVPNLVAMSALLNDYGTCDIHAIFGEKSNASKHILYNISSRYNKTIASLILDFGVKEGGCWTNETMGDAISVLYDEIVPQIAGSGIIGLAASCLKDPCLAGDYGFLDSRGRDKNISREWFVEGCGKYYYNAEGLTLATFSSQDRASSLCDPSRMFMMMQQMRCLLEQASTGK